MNRFYSGIGILVTAVLLLLFSQGTYAQTRVLKGRVLDESNNSPLPGANVVVAGSVQGTTTDANVTFSLTVPTNAQQLVISFVGYVRKEIQITNAGDYSITLVADESTLSEVVVIGYGSREKKDLTGAISTVSSKDIGKSIAQAPELAMQGRMAGVYVSTPGGSPLARPQVRIRGVSTFGFAEPLYVVDGIPITEYGAGTDNASGSVTRDIRGNVNVLSMINPNDIESIEVKKDAAASAIYGAQGSNGVVLITTKRGKAGKTKFKVSFQEGQTSLLKKLDVLTASEFATLKIEGFVNRALATNANVETARASAITQFGDPATVQNTDWQSYVYRTGRLRMIDASASGGDGKTNFYLATSYNYQEGQIIKSDFGRGTVRLNVDHQANKKC